MQNWKRVLAFLLTLCLLSGLCVSLAEEAEDELEIGDDVLIAPLYFVNFDVPSHSIVVGNPAKIVHREHATESYITHCPD